MPHNPLLRFLACFAILYAALLLPWPGLKDAYCSWFRTLASLVLGSSDSRREITFEPLDDPARPRFTRAVIVNRSLMKPDGSGPVRNLDLDTSAFGWGPTALLVSLVLATPLPWKRRWRALFLGLILEQGFIVLWLAYFVWYDSAEIALVAFTPFWRHAASVFRETLLGQINLAAPVLIWILVTFRRGDRENEKAVVSRKDAKAAKGMVL